MNFIVDRNDLYQSLQKIIRIISNRPRLPILSHILLETNKNCLCLVATNLETEIVSQILLDQEYESRSMTIPGRKFLEICRNLPEQSKLRIISKDGKIFINSECTNFSLSTLSSTSFPKIRICQNESYIVISQFILGKMIELTQFAMGNQDARYYLNGIFLKTEKNIIQMVATDGYRLAISEVTLDVSLPSKSVIIPRKGIIEILHLLLDKSKEFVKIQIYDNCIYMQIGNFSFSSNLIDSEFPNYSSVFLNQPKNIFEIDRIKLKQALKRASVLSNEKLRVVNFNLSMNLLKITTHNFDQESSTESLIISYLGINIEISFNVDYILDIINVIDTQILKFFLIDSISSVQIEGIPKSFGSTYLIMPIRM